MEEFYTQIRAVHIGAVTVSGVLFVVRWLMLNTAGAAWIRALPLRIASWIIDTTLLTAALMLTTVVRQYPFADTWLTAKVLLLVLYIALGAMALKAERPRKVRLATGVVAICLFVFIVTIARTRNPAGGLALFWS
ncbi:MAG: hypothetical protein A2882_05245 [Phenylobacterium sp. RIFCSPHIGHO2_01_FULL_70_10]|nr:MAG: hypothetical protein A2882_05245 [Phenylobacterium sp. RIFCSPHIGHO2_01_FULL_70_10]